MKIQMAGNGKICREAYLDVSTLTKHYSEYSPVKHLHQKNVNFLTGDVFGILYNLDIWRSIVANVTGSTVQHLPFRVKSKAIAG